MSKMIIPKEVKDVLEEANLAWVGTCSNGVPNVNIVYFFKLIEGDKILLADNYFNKTRNNIERNPNVAITVKSSEGSIAYELKGSAEIYTEGEIFEKMEEWVLSENEDMPTKAAVVVNIEDIYDSSPGESAGEKIST